MNFAVPLEHNVKIKESERMNKFLDFAREVKKLWNMKVMVVLIVTWDGPKRFGRKTGGRIETIQTRLL